MKYKAGDKIKALVDLPRGNIPKGHILTIIWVEYGESDWLFWTQSGSSEYEAWLGWRKTEEHLFEKVEEETNITCEDQCEYVKLKETKIKNIMTNIKNYIKNLALTSDEKLLRKYNLKTECGEYTQDAKSIIMQKLCADNEAYLIEIAKGIDAEENGNK